VRPMSEALKDHPNVVVFPPLVPLAILVLSVALQWLAPLRGLAAIDPVPRIIAGAIVAVGGILVTINGGRALARRQTNVNPLLPTLALATDGIFRFTRNPMYVGGMTALAGLALIFALDWLVLLMIPAAFVLHHGIVSREEQYLLRKFGDEYRRYRAQAPRYLPLIG
jgi:protein-S-isoprenylcysteine O-methyltransferase Ste14